MHLFELPFPFSQMNQKLEMLDHMVIVLLIFFLANSILFYLMSAPIFICFIFFLMTLQTKRAKYSPKKYKWDYLGCLYLLVVVTNNALTINVDLQTISKQMLITLFLYYSLTYLV